MDDPTENPVEEAIEEAKAGRSPRTPLLVVAGVALLIGAVVALVLGIVLLVNRLA